MGQEKRARQIVDENNAIKKLGFEFVVGYTGLAAVPARYALERQAWKEAAALEPRGSPFPQAEAITYFARAMGSARSGDLAAAEQGIAKLKELRADPGKGEPALLGRAGRNPDPGRHRPGSRRPRDSKDDARKFMRAAADLEDGSEKHVAMENRLYPMRELLGDLLLEQQQPAQALEGIRDRDRVDAEPAARALWRRERRRHGQRAAKGEPLFPQAL